MGLKQSKILKKVKSLLVIMDLVMMKITNNFLCKCKSKNCCGYIVRAESRWRINKKFAMSNKKINK